MKRQVLLALSVLCFLDAAVFGQSYSLELGSVRGAYDSELGIPLTLSTDAELRGVQAVFEWDASSGTGVALNVEPSIEDGADFALWYVDASWMSLAIVTTSLPITGANILLATAVIHCHPEPGVFDTPVVFRDDVHRASSSAPVLSNVVTSDGESVRRAAGLQLIDGMFSCRAGTAFVRGDGNGDRTVDISDAAIVLSCLFSGRLCPNCLDSADCNDDGALDISDVVCVVGCLFGSGSCPDSPFPDCGVDETADLMGCDQYPSCL